MLHFPMRESCRVSSRGFALGIQLEQVRGMTATRIAHPELSPPVFKQENSNGEYMFRTV